MKYFRKNKTSKLRSNFKIQFQNEQGEDLGGPLREYFFLLGEYIFAKEKGLFDVCQGNNNKSLYISNYYQVQKLEYYYFVGQFLAVSILQKQTITARLQEILLKMILNKQIIFKDFKTFDQTFYQSLLFIMNYDEVQDLEIYMNIDYELNGQKYNKKLNPSQKNRKVTNVNKQDYIFQSIQFLVYNKYKEAIDNFVDGFHNIIPSYFLKDFTAEELGYLISGDQIIFASEIIDNITCSSGYTRSSQTIQLLFKYLEDLQAKDQEGQNMLRGFLQFITGSGQIPYGGLRNLRDTNGEYSKLNISLSSQKIDSLPTAATCFNSMKIPPYQTYKLLKNKMDSAINYGKCGFEFV